MFLVFFVVLGMIFERRKGLKGIYSTISKTPHYFFINIIVRPSLTFKNKQFCGHIFLINKILSSNTLTVWAMLIFTKSRKVQMSIFSP